MTKLHLNKELKFLSDAASERHFAEFSAFCSANKFDAFQDYVRQMDVAGFNQRQLCFRCDRFSSYIAYGCFYFSAWL